MYRLRRILAVSPAVVELIEFNVYVSKYISSRWRCQWELELPVSLRPPAILLPRARRRVVGPIISILREERGRGSQWDRDGVVRLEAGWLRGRAAEIAGRDAAAAGDDDQAAGVDAEDDGEDR